MNKHKIILTGGVAKRLLMRGHYLCDLKPKREKPQESCYIFYKDKWLQDDIDNIMSEQSASDREVLERRLMALNMTEAQYKLTILLDCFSGEEKNV